MNDYGYEGTLRDEVVFRGTKFIGRGESVVTVSPSKSEGIIFRVRGEEIPYRPEYLHSHRMGFSHILTLANHIVDKPEIRDLFLFVPEHLRSALYLAGIDRATVDVQGRVLEKGEGASVLTQLVFGKIPSNWNAASMPIMDGGISDFYNKFKENRFPLEFKRKTYEVARTFEFESPYGGVKVFPKSKFSVLVEGMPHDKYRLRPLDFKVDDVYQSTEVNLKARALSREPKIKLALAKIFARQIYQLFEGFSNDESYLKIEPKMPDYQKRDLMLGRYREGMNEPFAHMVFSDMVGELATFFPGNIQGEFVFSNLGGGHTGRLEAFRRMRDHEVIIRAE